MIRRIMSIIVDGEREVLAQRGEGVGDLTGTLAVIGEVRGDVGEDDEPPGSSGVSGDGVYLRRSSAAAHGQLGSNWAAMVGNVEQREVEEVQRGEGKLEV
jgi:hypothetical protein